MACLPRWLRWWSVLLVCGLALSGAFATDADTLGTQPPGYYKGANHATFHVGGSGTQYYPVIFEEGDIGWSSGITKFWISRSNVHLDANWKGTLQLELEVHTGLWGNQTTPLLRSFVHQEGNSFVGGYALYFYGRQVVVWLKGDTTYDWRSDKQAALVDGNPQGVSKSIQVPGMPESLVNYAIKSTVDPNVLNNTHLVDYDFVGKAGMKLGNAAYPWDVIFAKEIRSGNSSQGIVTFDTEGLKVSNAEGAPGNPVRLGSAYGMPGLYRQGTLTIRAEGAPLVLQPTAGFVGIGITNPKSALQVNGTIIAKEVKVTMDAATWADYVFADGYRLRPLAEVEALIKRTRHLPGIPSAAEIARDGLPLSSMMAKQMEKIEELTLYTIALEKENQERKREVAETRGENDELRARLEAIERTLAKLSE